MARRINREKLDRLLKQAGIPANLQAAAHAANEGQGVSESSQNPTSLRGPEAPAPEPVAPPDPVPAVTRKRGHGAPAVVVVKRRSM